MEKILIIFVDRLQKIASDKFYTVRGLISGVFLTIIIWCAVWRYVVPDEVKHINYSLPFFGFLLIFFIVAFFIYWYIQTYSYPIRSAKKLGLVISVKTEDDTQKRYLLADFVLPLRDQINRSKLPYDVLVLKPHQANLVNTRDDAETILKETRAQMIVYGSIKDRNDSIFILHGLVIHSPIDQVNKILLEKQFAFLLPNKVAFEKALQFETYEARVEQVFNAATYIVGKCALLSGDPLTAIALHESLYSKISQGCKSPFIVGELGMLIASEYNLFAEQQYFNGKTINSLRDSIKKSLNFDSTNYGALLKSAIINFYDGNINDAMVDIQKAKRHSANTFEWLYSMVFLHLWLGDYPSAVDCCNRLKNGSYPSEQITINEVLKFTQEQYATSHKPQLLYWLAFICYYKKNDRKSAIEFFNDFLKKSDDSMIMLRERAMSYVSSPNFKNNG